MNQGILAKEPVYLWGIWNITDIGGVFSWAIFRYPHLLVAYIVYFIASLAECNRAPFDIPEAESELVAGFHVEYTGFRFGIIFLAEYAKMLLTAMLGSIVFLGGWNTLLPNLSIGEITIPLASWTTGDPYAWSGMAWGIFWLLGKGMLIVLFQMWIRWTYPRLRADQLMHLCWKILTPTALVLLAITIVWRLAEVYYHL